MINFILAFCTVYKCHFAYVFICACDSVCVYTVLISACVCVCVCVCVSVCVHDCVYIFIL